MFNSVSHSSVWVINQDEALDFYVGKLGFEVRADIQLENMRWLTVGMPDQPEFQILLESIDNPFIDDESREAMRSLLSKGMAGLGCILNTSDCRKTYAELMAKGVEGIQEPTDMFYGTDAAIRDPFGNHIRITQPVPDDEFEVPEPGDPELARKYNE